MTSVENELLIGIQTPRIRVFPSSALRQPHDDKAVVSRASEAIDLASLTGLYLDEWQCGVLEDTLAVREETYWNDLLQREEPRWATNEHGTVVARQNGKGAVIEARCLAGLFLFGEKKIVYSAHQFKTAQEMFKRTRLLIERTPDLRREVQAIRESHVSEGIYLHSGQELTFNARSKSAARGFSCDTLFLDEAMMKLGSDEIEACRPTISARPNYQILLYGSAGTEESEYFGKQRARAKKVFDLGQQTNDSVPRFGWAEWSVELHNDYCPEDCTDHDDRGDVTTWLKTNPGAGERLRIETIQDEYDSMSVGGFNKERLSVGRWPVEGGGWLAIPKDSWETRANSASSLEGKLALALNT